MPTNEVGIRLVIDSNAQKVAAAMRGAFEGMQSSARGAVGGIRTVFGAMGSTVSTVAGAIKNNWGGAAAVIGEGVAGSYALVAAAATGAAGVVIGLAAKSAHAFYEEEQQIRAVAAAFLVLDQKGNSFEKLLDLANLVNDDLTKIAVTAGTTDDAMREVFTTIIERGGKSVDEAADLTASMAMAGKAIPGGAKTLAEGFSAIEAGMVRAKNPLVGLISATGTLHGSAKSVAKQMQTMSIDKQMELAEKAVGKLALKMKDAPLTLGQMRAGMETIVQNVFESAGGPIVRAFEPVMGRAYKLLVDNQDKVNAAAEIFGKYMGKGVEVAGLVFDEVVSAVTNNWGAIVSTANEVFGPLRSAFAYVYDNKEAFAKTMVDVATVLIKAATMIIQAMEKVYTTAGGALKTVALAVGGQNYAKQEASTSVATEVIGKYKEQGARGGMGALKAGEAVISPEMMEGFKSRMVEAGASYDEAIKVITDAMNRGRDEMQGTADLVASATAADASFNAEAYVNAYNKAAAMHDDAAAKQIVAVLKGNVAMATAIGEMGPEIFKGGVNKFLETLSELDPAQSTMLKKKFAANLGKPGGSTVNQTFTGGIQIKQDFRDQDPDQIMVMMRRDLARAGTTRVQARTGTLFGF